MEQLVSVGNVSFPLPSSLSPLHQGAVLPNMALLLSTEINMKMVHTGCNSSCKGEAFVPTNPAVSCCPGQFWPADCSHSLPRKFLSLWKTPFLLQQFCSRRALIKAKQELHEPELIGQCYLADLTPCQMHRRKAKVLFRFSCKQSRAELTRKFHDKQGDSEFFPYQGSLNQ